MTLEELKTIKPGDKVLSPTGFEYQVIKVNIHDFNGYDLFLSDQYWYSMWQCELIKEEEDHNWLSEIDV